MSTWGTIKSEVQDLLDDEVFDAGGSAVDYLLTWANRIVDEISNEVQIRNTLKTSDAIAFTTSDYRIAVPTDFFAISDRFTKVRKSGADDYISIIALDAILAYDPNHSSTTTNTVPDYCAIEGGYIYVYPMFAGNIVLENYYPRITVMTSTSSSPGLPYVYYIDDLIISGIAGKYGFPWLGEYDQAGWWKNQYKEYLEKYRLHLEKSNSAKEIERTYY
jgi:hypothetical protein